MSQWTTHEGEETGKVHSQKVKVNYLPPEGHPLSEDDEYHNRMSMLSGVAQDDPVRRHPPINCQHLTFP